MISIDPNMVVILAALLCALVCLAGLALVARCTCRHARRSSPFAGNSITMTLPLPPTPRGLKKKAIDALPVTAVKEGHQLEEQCAICLAEFARGDEVRVLPHCGHGFHAACVDVWLLSSSTCPSCRRTLVVAADQSPAATESSTPQTCCERADVVAAQASAAGRCRSSAQ